MDSPPDKPPVSTRWAGQVLLNQRLSGLCCLETCAQRFVQCFSVFGALPAPPSRLLTMNYKGGTFQTTQQHSVLGSPSPAPCLPQTINPWGSSGACLCLRHTSDLI